jgi:small-conductance mechanosensitive channel
MLERIAAYCARDLSTDRLALLLTMVAAALVTLPLARLLTRGLRRRFRGEVEPVSPSQRAWLTVRIAPVWPLLTAVLATAPLLLLPGVATVAGRLRVLSLAWFLLLHGVVDLTIQQTMSRGPRRRRLRWLVVPLVILIVLLDQVRLLHPLLGWLDHPFLVLGAAHLSALSVLTGLGLALVFILGARVLADLLAHRLLPGLGVEPALADALGTVVRSLTIVLGLLVAAEAMGLDMSSLKIVLGALSVGIGFGLQNVVNNFVSGLILMFERTIKRGDIIRINQTEGRVTAIGLRSSVIRTRAGHDIIVPNGELVAGQVDNLSFTDENVRVDIPVGVSYGADPELVRRVLLEVVAGMEGIDAEPPPEVLFMGLGESSLDFEIRIWVRGAWTLPRVRSRVLFDGWYALKAAGVEIPFPQRDLHLRSGVLRVRQVTGDEPED